MGGAAQQGKSLTPPDEPQIPDPKSPQQLPQPTRWSNREPSFRHFPQTTMLPRQPFLALLLLLMLINLGQALVHYQKLLPQRHGSSSQSNHHCGLYMRMNPTSFDGSNFVITEFPRPALRRVPNAPVERFDKELESLAEEMISVMYQANGVGLAAPQVGLNDMMFVYNPSGDPEVKAMERVVCNPKIVEYSTETEVEEEACLSFRSDDCPGSVARSSWIQVVYQNELGQQIRRRLKGFEARVFQHEYDHLLGLLCWDRFPPEDREAVKANIDKLLGLYPEEDAVIDPHPDQLKIMQPPPLTARRMPPLEAEGEPEKKTAAPKAKTGFGAPGGFGGGSKSKRAKKKKAKK
ncbi:Peptide deformylase [Seminavis robusta]|uniref:Peptide deformylase n=1 Tax=Seminavis robusta TaxID=568900 RepID=A0A9N8ERZ3_9STRA|nr:Peptide deformylase [Seminavis robusta]|eukprot:Sro1665_g289550.1 Peptide deformylase (349) ;mRNA; r:2495-3710